MEPIPSSLDAPSLLTCDFLFEDIDPNDPDVREAVTRLKDADRALLHEAEPHVVAYCKDMLSLVGDEDRPEIKLDAPGDVWKYVQLGAELYVSRRRRGDAEDGVYFSLECNCDWEPEHGMQLVIKDGRVVKKVSEYDGHLTNTDAFADPTLVGVVYVPMSRH